MREKQPMPEWFLRTINYRVAKEESLRGVLESRKW
jgi:hypothetical protein